MEIEDHKGRSSAEGCCIRENLRGLTSERGNTVEGILFALVEHSSCWGDLKFKMEAF